MHAQCQGVPLYTVDVKAKTVYSFNYNGYNYRDDHIIQQYGISRDNSKYINRSVKK